MTNLLTTKALPDNLTPTTQKEFESFLISNRKKVHALIDDYASGSIALEEFQNRFYVLLRDGHASAWMLGRFRSGNFDNSESDQLRDFLVGRAKADALTSFIQGLVDRINVGDYTDEEGNLKISKIKLHGDLYVKQMRGTANEAFVELSDDETYFEWILGAIEKHCDRCPQMASMNPWTKQTLFTYPGAGDTPCLGNCKCHLKRLDDGLTSFKPVSFS